MRLKIFFFLLLFYAVITTSCKKKIEMPSAEIEKLTGADEIIENVTMISISRQNVEWQMKAALSKRFTGDKFMVAYDVEMETINTQDKNFYSSDSVYVYEIKDEYVGMGNVVIISPKAVLKTDKIIWNRLTDSIFAPDEVYIVRDRHQMWGTTLYTNSTLDYINLMNVKGQGTVDEKIFTP